MSSFINDTGFSTQPVPARPAVIRPPWALPESVFMALCTGCSDCRDECPRGLLQKGADGLPVIDFKQGDCNFCGECVEACAQGALSRRYQGATWEPWQLKAYVAADCLGDLGILCRRCIGHCGAQAIQFNSHTGSRIPAIDKERCNGCGACAPQCPVAAIGLYDALSQ